MVWSFANVQIQDRYCLPMSFPCLSLSEVCGPPATKCLCDSPIHLGWIMHLKEEQNKILVAYAAGIIFDEQTLGMFAEIIICRMTMFTISSIDYLCIKRILTPKLFSKQAFYSPKATFLVIYVPLSMNNYNIPAAKSANCSLPAGTNRCAGLTVRTLSIRRFKDISRVACSPDTSCQCRRHSQCYLSCWRKSRKNLLPHNAHSGPKPKLPQNSAARRRRRRHHNLH